MKLEDVKKWHDNYKTQWWLPDLFEDELCLDPLFPLYMTGLLKNIEDHRIIVRLNTDFPQLKASVRAADYTKKLDLTKEELAQISPAELVKMKKVALRTPAAYEPPSESVMEHTKLIEDAVLSHLMIKEGVIYDPEKRFVFTPDSAIKKLSLLPEQPINAMIDAYVFHIGNQCCIQKVAHNAETDVNFQIYPDLSDVKVTPISLSELLRIADVNVLSQDEIENLCQVVESYAFPSNEVAKQELSVVLGSEDFFKLCECMEKSVETVKINILMVQTMLPYKEIKETLALQESLGLSEAEGVSMVFAKLLPEIKPEALPEVAAGPSA